MPRTGAREGEGSDDEEEEDDSEGEEQLRARCYDDPDTSDDDDFKGVSALHTTLNLAKCMIGEGMLSLASGLGASMGLAVGVLICVGFACLMAYTFSLLGRICEATRSKSLREICQRVGYPLLGQAMTWSITILTYLACVSFCIIIGDSMSNVLSSFGVEGIWAGYKFSLISAIIVVEVPLCLIRDMSKLALTSLLGVACEISVICFMALRAFDGSYAPSGRFYASLKEENLPDFGDGIGKTLFRVTPDTGVLVCCLATAYISHFQSPKFYHQLRRRSVQRFNAVTSTSFGLASTVFVSSMSFGYLTFGRNSDGDILNNYSDKDPLATAARLAMLIAVACGFPIVFTGLRDSLLQAFSLRGKQRREWVMCTLSTLLPVVSLACFVTDLGVLNALVGSIMGALTTLAFPAILCYLAFQKVGAKLCRSSEGVVGSAAILAISLGLAIGGTFVVLKRDL